MAEFLWRRMEIFMIPFPSLSNGPIVQIASRRDLHFAISCRGGCRGAWLGEGGGRWAGGGMGRCRGKVIEEKEGEGENRMVR